MTTPGIPEPQPAVPPQWVGVRPGEVIVSVHDDPTRPNHVRSGFRIVAALPLGLKVRRVHACHLLEPMEEWLLRWDQLESLRLLPHGIQLPLL